MMIKVIEVLSTSPNSWEEAKQNAVKEASKTICNITGVDVIGFKAEVKDEKIMEYRLSSDLSPDTTRVADGIPIGSKLPSITLN